MRLSICCAAVISALTFTAAATAQTAPAAASVTAGGLLKSSDGKRIGRIERVVLNSAGAPVSASLIVDSRFVYVPVTTISSAEGGFVTTLTRAEVRKLK